MIKIMRYRFKCKTSYTLNGQIFKYGDITSDAKLALIFHYLFEEVVEDKKEEKEVTKGNKDVLLEDMKIIDLQKLAEQLNIKIAKSWSKAKLINNIRENKNVK